MPKRRRPTREEKRLLQAQADDRSVIRMYERENTELKQKLQQRVDTTMLEERRKLASVIGQTLEAFARMIHVVVGKEVM